VPRRRRERRARTHDWQAIQQQTLWPEQEAYERLRPIVLFGETAASRAKETGVSERTLHYQADLFERFGMVSLFPKAAASPSDPGQRLPPEMRQLIVDLKAEHPAFRPHEIARICYVRFGRKPSDHTVKRILAEGPPPSATTRRYPPYAQIADPYQRRRAMVDLHAQGWSHTNIADYLQTPRHRVYEVLERWARFGHAGLDDLPQQHPRKTGIREIHEVGKLVVDSPELGAYRVRAALEQIGIQLSQATCGRLLALNRPLYGVGKPTGGAPRQRKEMPFRASYRHEWWSVDVRYIEEHQLGFPEPLYMISILENYSRAILASKISRTQNQWDFLEVLFAALSTAGAPKGLVSDGGGIFSCNQVMDVYAALSISKERIEKRQAWQNYIETHFNIARKMSDARFARATSWEEVLAIHRRFLRDYNLQRHWAHESREDGCHSPVEVLDWHKGTMYPPSVLDRILFATRYTRHLDTHGLLRFQNWKLYAERGLPRAPVTVWVYDGSLKIEYQAVTLATYSVEVEDDHRHLRQVSNPRLVQTPFRSPQLTLWTLSPDEWVLYWRTPDLIPARRKRLASEISQQMLFDLAEVELAVGAEGVGGPHPWLRVVPKDPPHEAEE
jgi:putative transposase